MWDAATGQPVGEPLRHDDYVTAASFSPDGSRVVTASWDKTARVWDATTGQPVGEPLRHDDKVTAAFFSPDGSRVVTSSDDKTARVWDATTGQPVGEPLRHDGGVTAASFSPDGSRVLTASWDKTARVWDTVVGQADEAELLAELAEACSGYSISDAGAPVPLSDRADRLATLRRQALDAPAGMPTIASVARWLFEHPWYRTVSPLSRMTVADYIQGCLQSGAGDEARRAFPGHPMLRDDASTPPTRPPASRTRRASTSRSRT